MYILAVSPATIKSVCLMCVCLWKGGVFCREKLESRCICGEDWSITEHGWRDSIHIRVPGVPRQPFYHREHAQEHTAASYSHGAIRAVWRSIGTVAIGLTLTAAQLSAQLLSRRHTSRQSVSRVLDRASLMAKGKPQRNLTLTLWFTTEPAGTTKNSWCMFAHIAWMRYWHLWMVAQVYDRNQCYPEFLVEYRRMWYKMGDWRSWECWETLLVLTTGEFRWSDVVDAYHHLPLVHVHHLIFIKDA